MKFIIFLSIKCCAVVSTCKNITNVILSTEMLVFPVLLTILEILLHIIYMLCDVITCVIDVHYLYNVQKYADIAPKIVLAL